MRDIDFNQLLKDPKLYYVLVPIVCAIWPLWAALIALPAAQTAWSSEKDGYAQAEK